MEHDDGMVLLNKPAGVTSFSALGHLKQTLGTKRIGHTGTIDRFASGLLIALSGRLTRISWLITDLPKRYRAVIRFGEQTTTLDPSGQVELRRPLPQVQAIIEAIPKFIGNIQQVPPAYSAVHIDGERASQRARRGETVLPIAREVRIDSLQLVDINLPLLTIDVVCSTGTYVRSLARDLAVAAGSCAHLIDLRREAIGDFTVKEAVSINAANASNLVRPEQFLCRVDGVEIHFVTSEGAQSIRYGKPIDSHFLISEPSGLHPCALFYGIELLAIVEPRDWTNLSKPSFRYRCVLSPPDRAQSL